MKLFLIILGIQFIRLKFSFIWIEQSENLLYHLSVNSNCKYEAKIQIISFLLKIKHESILSVYC